MMDLTEEMLSGMVLQICGSYKIPYKNGDKTVELDFTPPWPRVSMMEGQEQEHLFDLGWKA
jgi:lysyl-tRNA synthetase class 2